MSGYGPTNFKGCLVLGFMMVAMIVAAPYMWVRNKIRKWREKG